MRWRDASRRYLAAQCRQALRQTIPPSAARQQNTCNAITSVQPNSGSTFHIPYDIDVEGNSASPAAQLVQ
jgi:hypothetical protein